MLRNYQFALYYLWIAPHLLLIPVVVLLYVRRLHRSFPVFFAYNIYEIFEFLLLIACYAVSHGMGSVYRYVYIGTLAISTGLRFGIIKEVFQNIFHDYPRLERPATAFIRWITGLLVVTAVVAACYSAGTTSDNLMLGISLLSRSVAIIQAGVLLFLFILIRVLGLSLRAVAFGIALGFAIFSSTELAFWAIRLTNPGENIKRLLDLLPTGSYHVSVLIWLGYLLAAEKPVVMGAHSVPDIDQWSGELERSQ